MSHPHLRTRRVEKAVVVVGVYKRAMGLSVVEGDGDNFGRNGAHEPLVLNILARQPWPA